MGSTTKVCVQGIPAPETLWWRWLWGKMDNEGKSGCHLNEVRKTRFWELKLELGPTFSHSILVFSVDGKKPYIPDPLAWL